MRPLRRAALGIVVLTLSACGAADTVSGAPTHAPPATTAPTPAAGGAGGGLPAADRDRLAARYLVIAGHLNDAMASYDAAMTAAEARPCSCPPGMYDYSSARPQIRAYSDANARGSADWAALAAGAPEPLHTDLLALSDIALALSQDAAAQLAAVPGSRQDGLNAAKTHQDNLAAGPAVARARTDLGLPAPS